MNIIFAFSILHFSSGLQFKSELSEEIQLNELNLKSIANNLITVSKLSILGLHTVGTHHKTFDGKNIYFADSQGKTLSKEVTLPSVS
jgi:hypothetical protein